MPETNPNADIQFSDNELAELEQNSIALKTGERRDAVRLADSWAAHIDKIDHDRALPWSDRSVWNEYDFCAALAIRDYLNTAIENLPAPLSDKVSEYVSEADERYQAITAEDSGKRMAAVAQVDRTGRGWWWYRVPDSGPIVEDLARWAHLEAE
ncbi:hypothetical protein AB0L57_18460 [Nocardia sp. NPDC052254]|uniref:hypothetical protein n=1 Tax=Nocardia sp. NPDC052254 TaxID=3155681 RepID=UPI003438A507